VEPKWKGASVENSQFEMLRRQTRAWNRLAPAHLRVRKFQVNVVNARHTKTLPGRKTDVLECQWLQKLHTQTSRRPIDATFAGAL